MNGLLAQKIAPEARPFRIVSDDYSPAIAGTAAQMPAAAAISKLYLITFSYVGDLRSRSAIGSD
jgi:hypothetical protein